MNTNSQTKTTRRRFLLLSTVGGAGVAIAGYAVLAGRRKRGDDDLGNASELVRNPAFSARTERGSTVLSTTSSGGERIAYQLDKEGAFIWDNVPTSEEHLQGKKVTVNRLLDLAVEKYSHDGDLSVRESASAFLERALEAGILVDAEKKIYIEFKVAKR